MMKKSENMAIFRFLIKMTKKNQLLVWVWLF